MKSPLSAHPPPIGFQNPLDKTKLSMDCTSTVSHFNETNTRLDLEFVSRHEVPPRRGDCCLIAIALIWFEVRIFLWRHDAWVTVFRVSAGVTSSRLCSQLEDDRTDPSTDDLCMYACMSGFVCICRKANGTNDPIDIVSHGRTVVAWCKVCQRLFSASFVRSYPALPFVQINVRVATFRFP